MSRLRDLFPVVRPSAHLPLALLLAALALAAGPAAADESGTTAFVGATVHPISGPPIENATLVIEGDRIVGVGGQMAAPAGAEVIDLSGKHVYPGFVHPFTTLGLVEIGSVRGTNDTNEIGVNNADLRSEVAWNADSLRLLPTMAGGVLSVNVIQQGGSFLGTSALMRLDGWNWRDMTIEAPVGMHLSFPAVAAGGDDDEDENQGEALEAIDEILDDARTYAKARDADSPGLDLDPKLEALRPLIDGEMQLFVHARTRAQIEKALEWAEEQGFGPLVLITGSDVRYTVDALKAADASVILRGVLGIPTRDFEPYDAVYTAAQALHEAGVPFAIGDNGDGFSSANSRNLPFEAAMAVAFGLPRDAALRAITLTPAEILGVADRVGSLEAGKEASFFVSDGDPLEILTQIEDVWVAGRQVDLTRDHQHRLYERYWNRPLPEGKSRQSDQASP